MREVLEKKPVLTREEARDLIERCMKILYYRDARSFNRVSPEPRRRRPVQLNRYQTQSRVQSDVESGLWCGNGVSW